MSWQHSLLISSVHLTALATNVDCFHPEPQFFDCHDHYSLLTSSLVNAYEFLSTMFLFVIILHLLVFEQRTNIQQLEVRGHLSDIQFVNTKSCFFCGRPGGMEWPPS